jgi:hypothetical protein
VERTYSLVLFNQSHRLFTLAVQPDLIRDSFLLGVKCSNNMTEGELEHWMREAIISTENHLEDARIRRITGSPRAILQGQELFDIMPGRNVLIYRITNDPTFITPGVRLNVINFTDTDLKRPVEVFLYVPHGQQPMAEA